MGFLGSMIIWVVLSFLISGVVKNFLFKGIVITNRYKYYFISMGISLIVGVVIFSIFDNSTNAFVVGFLWGIIDGILQTTITLEND